MNKYKYILGIVNGTCNYVLSAMSEKGSSFEDAIVEAQELGFAEADPTFDIEGVDSAHKASILGTMGFQKFIKFDDIYMEGIKNITDEDIQFAKELGYNIKLIALIQEVDNKIDIRVHPAMLDENSEIANVNGVLNAVESIGDMTGYSLMVGEGAGSLPTASAVIGDVLEIAGDFINKKNNHGECKIVPPLGTDVSAIEQGEVLPIDEIESEYYLNFHILDKPKVLSKVTGILGNYNISIGSVIQQDRDAGEYVPVVMLTHHAKEKDIQAALKDIEQEDYCQQIKLIRVVDVS